jgi:multicomponent Na+:H+ antiporter subunit B
VTDPDPGDDADPDKDADAPAQPDDRRRRSTYTESEVIMSTVRVVTPFVLTFGFYITFHGADSPGGGFQGGALVGTVILMLAFAFGVDSTRRWLGDRGITLAALLGIVVFAGIGIGSVALGGGFLEYTSYPIETPTKYGIEAVEIGGIALIVGGVITGLFFLTAAGPRGEQS